jgi:ubiquinone biosynthesis protein UbiJ
MFRTLVLIVSLQAVCASAWAQDVKGIEICTVESRMDRRTGCLQSNVEFLQQTITKNTLDAQQKLASAHKEIAALKEALANLQARVDQLQKEKAQGQ